MVFSGFFFLSPDSFIHLHLFTTKKEVPSPLHLIVAIRINQLIVLESFVRMQESGKGPGPSTFFSLLLKANLPRGLPISVTSFFCPQISSL